MADIAVNTGASITRVIEQELLMSLDHLPNCPTLHMPVEEVSEKHCTCGAVLAEKNKYIALLGTRLLQQRDARDKLLRNIVEAIDQSVTRLENPQRPHTSVRDAKVSVETLRFATGLIVKAFTGSLNKNVSEHADQLAGRLTDMMENGLTDQLIEFCITGLEGDVREATKARIEKSLQFVVHGAASPI